MAAENNITTRAKVRQFALTFSRTINLGRYESARVEATVVVEVDGEKALAPQKEEAQHELRLLMEETWRAQFKPKEKEQLSKQV